MSLSEGNSNKNINSAFSIFLFVFLLGLVWNLGFKDSLAAGAPWIQTDWSDGTASGTVSTNVATYESQSNIDTSVAGEISLQQTSGWSATYDSWSKRKLITVTNAGSEQTDYQVQLAVTYDGDMQTDFDDLRFANSSGTALDYWIQSKTDSTSAVVWVEVDSLAASGNTEIYMYYGNSGASSGSDGEATFVFFDDFSAGSIDGTKWTNSGVGTVVSGELRMYATNSAWNNYLYGQTTYARSDLSVEMKSRWVSTNSSYDAVMVGWHDSGSGASYQDLVYAYYNPGSGSCTSGCPVLVYEDGSGRGTKTGSWTVNQQYLIRVRMKSGGGAYYEQSTDDGASWTTSYDSSYSTESNLRPGIAIHSGDHRYDDLRVRKWMTSEPTSVFGSEEDIYPSSGSLTSNIFDAGSGQDWETLTYTTSGSGTVTVKARSSNNSDMSGADEFSSCSAISSGATASTNACVTDNNRYIQYQVTLAPSGANSPVLEDIQFGKSDSDTTAPTTNASSVLMSKSNGGDSVSSNGWNNSATPYFSWTAGADNVGGSGLKGYCLYLGTDSAGNPSTSKGVLGTSPVSTSGSTCQFIVSSTSIDLSTSGYLGSALASGTTYYLNIKAIDLGNNTFAGSSAQFQFRHDVTAPTNVTAICSPGGTFSSVTDMSFSWTTSTCASAATDSDSGVLGYQYQLNSTAGSWVGTSTDATCGLDYIPSATYSRTLSSVDEDNIVIGANIIYFRTVDVACNTSSSATVRTGSINYGGAAPTFGGSDVVTVTPSTSTTNSFAFSWPAATPSDGRTISKYYYMINTSPPSSLSTITSNTSTYIDNGSSTSVSAGTVAGAVKGANTIKVVTVDDDDNYSPSSVITGTFTLNSTNPDPPTNLSASDASVKSASLWRASLAWGVPSYKGTGSLTYKVQRSTNGSSWTDVATTSGTAYVDTVTSSAQYYWRVCSYDTSSSSIASPSCASGVTLTPKGTFTEPPVMSDDPVVSGITTKNATITWNTDRVSDSKVQFGTSSGDYNDEEPSNSDQVTSHTISLTNLSPGTNYYYTAKWTDEDGNTGISDEFQFSTSPAPTVTDPIVKTLGISDAIIQFTVKDSYKAKIYYGKSTAFGGSSEISTSSSEAIYNMTLDGLEDGTKYFYKINTFDVEGSEYEGSTLSFETLPRPQVSAVRIQQVANTAESSVLVSWQTNTEVSSIVTYYPENNPSQARDEVNIALQRGEHKMVVRGLQPQTSYLMIVKGIDKAGNQATSDTQRFTTATDTRPPQISDLSTEGSTQILDASSQESVAQIVVSWNTDEPATSQVEFGEGAGTTYSQKTQEDSNATLNHLVVISGLTPSKVYHLRAISKDLNGNISESVDTVTITPKATDNALDLVISNLQEAFGFIGDIR